MQHCGHFVAGLFGKSGNAPCFFKLFFDGGIINRLIGLINVRQGAHIAGSLNIVLASQWI